MIDRHVRKFVEVFAQPDRDDAVCVAYLNVLKLRYGLTHMDIAAIVSEHLEGSKSDEVLSDLIRIDKESENDHS